MENIHLIGRSVITSELLDVSLSACMVTDTEVITGSGDYPWISPGFFDIQVNGYKGLDYSSDTLKGDHLSAVIEALGKAGTTRHLPTIITAPRERIVQNLKILASMLDENPDMEYAVPGFHIEGPYISEIDGPRGAHDATYIRDPDFEEFLTWQEASGGRIKIVTLAPERRGALDFIKKITAAGVTAAVGHSAAAPEVIKKAVKAGASLSTHLGNGSHAELPRLRNYLWEQLADDNLYASIISDGFHLPDAVIKTFYRTKGSDKLILTSDVSPAGGSAPGRYTWDKIKVDVHSDGHVGLAGTPYLAGAGHLLDRDIARFIKASSCSVPDAVKLCTVNPSRMLSLEERLGKNVVVFRYVEGDPSLNIEAVYEDGNDSFKF